MVLIIVCILAGLEAGIGTGLAGLSAAVVITPMLITFCGFTAYEAVGIANLKRGSYAPFFQESILGCSVDLSVRAGVCCS